MDTADTRNAQVAALLDRLDPRLDEPCRVPGCRHAAHPRLTVVLHDVADGLVAA